MIGWVLHSTIGPSPSLSDVVPRPRQFVLIIGMLFPLPFMSLCSQTKHLDHEKILGQCRFGKLLSLCLSLPRSWPVWLMPLVVLLCPSVGRFVAVMVSCGPSRRW